MICPFLTAGWLANPNSLTAGTGVISHLADCRTDNCALWDTGVWVCKLGHSQLVSQQVSVTGPKIAVDEVLQELSRRAIAGD